MNSQPDLIIRNARLRGEDSALIDIAVVGNKISNIESKIKSKAKLEIDASGIIVARGHSFSWTR
jgi:predicted amidohydrolase